MHKIKNYNNNNYNYHTKICKAHNISTRLNLRHRQSLGGKDMRIEGNLKQKLLLSCSHVSTLSSGG